jgi:hypothetical protein
MIGKIVEVEMINGKKVSFKLTEELLNQPVIMDEQQKLVYLEDGLCSCCKSKPDTCISLKILLMAESCADISYGRI